MYPKVAVPLAIWGAAFSLMAWLFFYFAPAIEATLFPVLTEQSIVIEPNDRSPGEMCWTWKWNKKRHARPLLVAWTIKVSGSAVFYQGVTRRERDKSIVGNPSLAALGPGQNDFCTIIPAFIDNAPGLVIRGVINYQVPHRLWTIWQDLPPVRVPPLSSSRED